MQFPFYHQILTQLGELRRQIQEMKDSQQTQRDADLTNAKLAAIVESSDDAIFSKTTEGIITTWNAGAERIFGYTAQEMIGRSITVLIPADHLHEEPKILERLRRGERVDHFNTVRITKDGRRIDVSLTISPIRDAEGKIIGASKIARDITQQRQTEEALKRARERAEQASAEKDQFLAVLSHELRTPLMPVLAGLSLIESGKLSPQDAQAEIATMRRSIELEAQLIDDLLDHTRIARGKIHLQREVLDVHQLIEAVIRMCLREIVAKNLVVEQFLTAEAAFVLADPKRIQQVLWNLLKNAIKFTPKGGRVTIRSHNQACMSALSTAGLPAGPGEMAFALDVTDSGIGIAPELLQRIFNAFDQGDQLVAKRFGGLGLGLAISRSFVHLHHGTLTAHSAGRGKGATFTMTLPGATFAPPLRTLPVVPPPIQQNHPDALRLLLVEDHADTRRMLTRLLRDRGFHVEYAGSVAQAIELLDATTFDVLVSDVGLPDGTGMQVMQHARRRQSLRGIAVSGFGSPDDARLSREAGFLLHLTKPIDVEKLETAIRALGTPSN